MTRLGIRLLLRLYPREFRERSAGEFVAFMERQRRERRYRSPLTGRARFWLEAAAEALAVGIGGRVRNGLKGGRRTMRGVAGDLRFAVRTLGRAPGYALLVVLTLGLGMGATTGVFSLANWVLLRPLPGATDFDRIVTVRFESLDGSGFFLVSRPDLDDLRARASDLEWFGATHESDAHLATGDGPPIRIAVEVVTPDYQPAIGFSTAMGRMPVGPDSRGEVMIGHQLWYDALGGDPEVLGRVVRINGLPFTVVGVAEPSFRGVQFPARTTEAWFSEASFTDVLPAYPETVADQRDRGIYLTGVGRLGPDGRRDRAEAQLRAARDGIVAAHPGASSLEKFTPAVYEGAGIPGWSRKRLRSMIAVLSGVVALLLLLACANAAGLMMGRGVGRTHEVAIRRALGASRVQITRQLVVEGALLGTGAGALGLALAAGVLELSEGARYTAYLSLESIQLDATVLVFALAVSAVTGVAFALVPAVASGSATGEGSLRSGARSTRAGSGLRKALVVGQIAISLGVLVASGLMIGTVRSLSGVDLGFDPEGVVEASVDPGRQRYSDAELVEFWTALRERTLAIPSVSSVGIAWAPPHGFLRSGERVRAVGMEDDEGIPVETNYVSAGYIGTVGLSLLSGRDFTHEEMHVPQSGVAIVAGSLAESLFGSTDAVGRTVVTRNGGELAIVGVIEDARVLSAKRETPVMLYPMGSVWTESWATLFVASSEGIGALEPRLREAVRELDPNLPLYDVGRLEDRFAASLAEEHLLARATSAFSLVALLLAGVGLYGILSQGVRARRRELGLRIAMGAGRAQVRRLVVGESARTTALGLLVGTGVAWMAGRIVSSRLWGVSPSQPWVLASAAVALALTALAASWVPASRAVRTNPIEVLEAD